VRANTVLRQMLEPITMTPIKKGGQIAWDLPRRSLSVVAGARNHEYYTVPDTFWIDLIP